MILLIGRVPGGVIRRHLPVIMAFFSSMAGHHCKQIAYAEVGGAQDYWYWDGSIEDGGVLPPDFYILTMQGLNALSLPRCSVPILVMY